MRTSVGFLFVLGIGCVVCYREPVCRGKEANLSQEDLGIMAECAKTFAPSAFDGETFDPAKLADSGVSLEKISCIGKCILTKEKFIDDKGKISKETMIAKINATMPAEVMEDLDKALGQCVDDHGWKIKPDAENTCTSYISLSVCMQAAIVDVCNEKKP